MLNQKLQHKLLQKLSPQQIQLIKLLEIPILQLEQRIKKEIEENPVLEEGAEEKDFSVEETQDSNDEDKQDDTQDEFTMEDYIEDEETPAYKLTVNNYSKDDKKNEIPLSGGISLPEHLENQLGMRVLDEKTQMLARYIIGNIDEDGYLRRELSAITDDLAFSSNIQTTKDELSEILKIIQDMEPSGVGASDLQQCLLLQTEKKIKKNEGNIQTLTDTKNILSTYFNELVKKHYEKIISRLGIDRERLKDVIKIVLRLNPKPGNVFANPMNKTSQHITPDFLIDFDDDRLSVMLHSRNVPDLKISKSYSDMINSYRNNKKNASTQQKNAFTFVKQKLDSAKWFIDAIKQRQNTLLLTMNAIVDYQFEYFKEGDETKLRPMILKDIAEKTNLDISTISRVANSKYVQTHFGIYPLKFFFSEGLQTQEGVEVSTREIKRILSECIESENKKKPLTDEKLAQILQDKGYKIARRTVAKYREQLGILVARLRKEL